MTMKKLGCVVLAAGILVAIGAQDAEAWGRRGRVHVSGGVFIGGPFWGPSVWWGPGWGWYAYPPPVYSPPVIIERQPQTYIQQQAPSAQQPYYWYYCADSKAYYPYVQQCPGGWLTVVPPTEPPGQ
jgi:hypothetical protein